jgi:hypothetical protein
VRAGVRGNETGESTKASLLSGSSVAQPAKRLAKYLSVECEEGLVLPAVYSKKPL